MANLLICLLYFRVSVCSIFCSYWEKKMIYVFWYEYVCIERRCHARCGSQSLQAIVGFVHKCPSNILQRNKWFIPISGQMHNTHIRVYSLWPRKHHQYSKQQHKSTKNNMIFFFNTFLRTKSWFECDLYFSFFNGQNAFISNNKFYSNNKSNWHPKPIVQN